MGAVPRPARTLDLGVTRTQALVLSHPARFQAIYANRRWGKSTCAQQRVILRCRAPNPYGLFWWLAPTYRQCRTPFLTLLRIFGQAGLLADHSRAEMRLHLTTGWRVEFRSLERPENVRGEGPDECVVDEADQVGDEAWHEDVRPALADKRAPTLAIGTPRRGRRSWFYSNYRRGLGGDPDYKGWRFTCYDAVFLDPAEIELARRTMPDRAFRQEFLAEVLDDGGAVFEQVRRRRRQAIPGEPVGIGVDWAKKVDYTWFVAVGARSGAVLEVRRLKHGLSYPRQVELLAGFVGQYADRGWHLTHDQTGVGEALADLLAQYRTPGGSRVFTEQNAEGEVWTNQAKRELVEEAVVDFEAGRLGWLFDAEKLDEDYARAIQEHEDYSLTVTKTGKVEYGAPEGLHDDAVSATILANRSRRRLAQRTLVATPNVTMIG